MPKIVIDTAQWYISHTCNLSCKNCYSFNNFSISGHERWADNEDYVRQWGQLVKVNDLSIIGGEPLSNPDLDLWVHGVRKYFDTEDFKICTNGTQLSKWQDKFAGWIDIGVILEINTHDQDHLSDTWKSLSKIANIKWIKGKDFDHKKYKNYDWVGTVNNRVVILQTRSESFLSWGVKGKNEHGEYELYESDPKRTHQFCLFKDCHYWYRGELYKCGTIVGAQKFVTKYPVKTEHKEKILAYTPISLSCENLQDQIETLTKNMIPQCSLCNNILKGKNSLDATNKKE